MTDEQISPAQEYITKDAISYSALSRLADGPQAFINKKRPTGDFLATGSAVDILLTEPDTFHDQFYVMTESKPSVDGMRLYTEAMIETDDHAQALIASGYKKAVSMEKWEEVGKPYYDAVKASSGKMILDMEQYMKVQAVVNQLKENEYTQQYFTDGAITQYDEVQYQFIHYFEFNKVPCKIKLDIVTISHTEKKIKGIDLKTTGKPVFAFPSSYRNFKYYLQGGLFQEGLRDWAKINYPDYTVEDFEFIVAEMNTNNPPLIFRMSQTEVTKAIMGGETSTGYPIKGIVDLLSDLDYYTTTGAWDYPAEIHKNNGVVDLTLFV
jgi:hypothetical protein